MNGFTLYKEYYELITLLPEKDQQELLLAIAKYMFENIEPKLNDKQTKIFNNLKRPLDKSKNKGRNGSITKSNENQNEIKIKSNENQNEIKKETHQDVNVNVNVNDIVNVKNISIEDIKEIIDYLNIKSNSHFKYSTDKTQSLIKARFNDGFKIEDFKVVIDKKCEEWLGTDFEKFIRPETLFSNKFDGYLNQKITKGSRNKKIDSQMEILKGIYYGQ